MAYLVSKYGTNDSLYPKNLQKRAIIDQRLYFEATEIFSQLRNIFVLEITFHFALYYKQSFQTAIFRQNKSTINEEDTDKANRGYKFMELFLENKKWVCGDTVTIADYSLVSSVTSLDFFVPIDSQKYPRITKWLKNCEELPECETNNKRLEEFKQFFTSKLQANAKNNNNVTS